jgi:hypothetical protein
VRRHPHPRPGRAVIAQEDSMTEDRAIRDVIVAAGLGVDAGAAR